MELKGKSKRILYFDILETIAIFMVVFCHYTTLGNTFLDNAFMTLCFIAVPVFFMINGALVMNKDTFDLKKHCKKTIKRYFTASIFRVIYLFFSLIKGTVGVSRLSLGGVLRYIFMWTDLNGCNVGHMWFMKSLLAINIITPIIYYGMFSKYAKKEIVKYGLIVLLIPFMIQDIDTILVWFGKRMLIDNVESLIPILDFLPFGNAREMLFFYIAGALIERKHVEICSGNYKKKRLLVALGFIISYMCMIFTRWAITGTLCWDGVPFPEGYKRMSTMIAAICFFVLFMLLFNTEKYLGNAKINMIFEMISANTLGIYYIHWIVGSFVVSIIDINAVWMNFLRSFLVLFVSLGISWILNQISFVKGLCQ